MTGENPLYRRTFVARESELRRLHAAFDEAASGRGGIVMVAGEPGIGKTSLCEQFAALVTLGGGRALVGHCYEAGSISLPYLPFVEALRGYILSREPDALKQDLGTGAGEVARIIPDVRERLAVEVQPSADPEEARYRLLQAVSDFLGNVSQDQPLLLVLEDLHGADRGTLNLLLHLSRNLSETRLLIVGTYRDVEVDRSHPLSEALAELYRGGSFLRLPLRGLVAAEVQQMLVAVSQQEVPEILAEFVHRQTEGNPLFVQEMLRYLIEEGLVEWREGALSRMGEERLAGRVPEGLRDVIGKRLSRLSRRANQVLAVASVIGREFQSDLLQRVAGLSEDEIDAALEEAVAVAAIEEHSVVGATVIYRFTHAFFRQTLYEDTLAPRRVRLHQQVARGLEALYARSASDGEQHAAELAEHYAYSSNPADLAKAVSYGELAAQRALNVYAHGEAARYFEQALRAQEALEPDDTAKRCDLLLALGDALLPAGEPGRVVETIAPQALELAEQLGDRQRASRACQAALEGIRRQRGARGGATPLFRNWAGEADRYAAPGSPDRVRADFALGLVDFFRDRRREGWELIQRALALAGQLDDGEGLYRVAWAIVSFGWLPEHEAERHHVAEALFLRQRAGVGDAAMGAFLHGCCLVFLAWGERDRFDEAAHQLRAIAERTRDASLSAFVLWLDVTRLALDGRLEDAVAVSETLRQRAAELGQPGVGAVGASQSAFWPLLHLGRAEQALTALPEDTRAVTSDGRFMRFGAFVALCLGSWGHWTEAQVLLEQLRTHLRNAGNLDSLNVSAAVHYLAAAVLSEDRELAAALRDSLAGLAALIDGNYPTCIARHLGAASALLGDRNAARRYYEQALAVATKVRFRPEIALAHLGLAELLLASPPGLLSSFTGEEVADRPEVRPAPSDAQRTEALRHLDFALAEFREMQMQPALEQLEAMLQRLTTSEAVSRKRRDLYLNGLSEREVQVLRLLASGRTNREIAVTLVISPGTVARHTANIYAKLDARSRAAAVAYAVRHNLADSPST